MDHTLRSTQAVMKSWLPTSVVVLVAALIVVLAGNAAAAQDPSGGFEGWHLEPGVGQAHLVMVARVTSISRVTVVEGAKTDVALREFRFQPIRRLKGIFQRDELSMTAADLGLSAADVTAPPLNEGEFRLLILVQPQGLLSYGCVAAAPGATTFAQRVPLLSGPDDSLVGVVETLIQVADSRSRREKVYLLIDRLASTNGLAAVPLLTSLRLRADWAAGEGALAPVQPWFGGGPAPGVLTRLVHARSTAVRGGAVEVLRDLFSIGGAPDEPVPLDEVAEALRDLLESDEPNTRIRLAALEALDRLLVLRNSVDSPIQFLTKELTTTATYAERAAAATALSRIARPESVKATLDALDALPLDEAPSREAAYARAAVRLDAAGAEKLLLARLQRSIAARQSLEAELMTLGRMRSMGSLPHLLAAAGQDTVSAADHHHIARALSRVGDDRAVPLLIGWLRGEDHRLKELALTALENIDSPVGAREARPLLKSEAHLPFKLRLARLLARHGLDDGYALATEHLADEEHMAAATLVLVALDDPRTADDLLAIVAARPDRHWRGAALTGLAATGDADAKMQLLEILADDRHPLAAGAAQAAGLADDSALLLPLAKLVQSRNQQLARASLVALRRFFSGVRSSPRGLAAVNSVFEELDDADLGIGDIGHGNSPTPAAEVPVETRAALAEAVASLAADAYVDLNIRREALAVTRLLDAERYTELLSNLADQAELEGTPLLLTVQAERRRPRGFVMPGDLK